MDFVGSREKLGQLCGHSRRVGLGCAPRGGVLKELGASNKPGEQVDRNVVEHDRDDHLVGSSSRLQKSHERTQGS